MSMSAQKIWFSKLQLVPFLPLKANMQPVSNHSFSRSSSISSYLDIQGVCSADCRHRIIYDISQDTILRRQDNLNELSAT